MKTKAQQGRFDGKVGDVVLVKDTGEIGKVVEIGVISCKVAIGKPTTTITLFDCEIEAFPTGGNHEQ